MATLKEIEDANRKNTEISTAGKDAAELLQRVASGLIESMKPEGASASSKIEQSRLGAFTKPDAKRLDEFIYVDSTDRAVTVVRLQVGNRTAHMDLSVRKLDVPMKDWDEMSFWEIGLHNGKGGGFLPENPTEERLQRLYRLISGSMKAEILKK